MFRDELERTSRVFSQNNKAPWFVFIQTVCSSRLDCQCWRVDRITGVYEIIKFDLPAYKMKKITCNSFFFFSFFYFEIMENETLVPG